MAAFGPDERAVFARRPGRQQPIALGAEWDDFQELAAGDDYYVLDNLVWEDGSVRFRLTYSGPLKAAGDNSNRSADKAAVRRYFSPQLAELWQTHPVFKAYGLTHTPPRKPADRPAFLPEPAPRPPAAGPVEVAPGQREAAAIFRAPKTVDGRQYFPLVRREFNTTCSLDILFLRKGARDPVMSGGGDLDNRLKTLFDALRMPLAGELPKPDPAADPEPPMFCLLENDDAIVNFAVRSDRLLTHPNAARAEVLLVIEVVIAPWHLTSTNLGFLSE